MPVLEAAVYTAFGLYNFINGRKYAKKFSNGKKAGIGVGTLAGIDSIVSPGFAGRTLRSLVGLSAGAYEPLVRLGENVLAYGSQIYHWYKNYKLSKNGEEKH